jgi:hypothetical protein
VENPVNPERGFYGVVELTEETELGWVREAGQTLAFSTVRLDAWREQDLPASLLDLVRRGLAAARQAGLKVVLRFAYNDGPYPRSDPDAPLLWVLRHVTQLGPLLREESDTVALVQAGFIGAWGEWHTSTHGLDNLVDKQAILEALLAELPADRHTQVRYPPDKQALYGGPLSPETALTGTPAARTGHHNDCFLSSATDMGTYPEGEQEQWKQYLAQDALWVPVGGETCAPHLPRTNCPTALEEMSRLHFSFINEDYHPDVVAAWSAQGCRSVMDRHLGYRLVLVEADLPVGARAGQPFPFRVTLRNDGWAAPFNPRPAVLVLQQGSVVVEVPLQGVEVRRWLPGAEVTLRQAVTVPGAFTPGPVSASLWLPDASARLRTAPAYAIRCANQGTWEEASGRNVLGTFAVAP